MDWAYAGDDLTFGNRFDDSEGYFRVLYAASNPLGCFIETLTRYRRAPTTAGLIAALRQIENAEPDYIAPGAVPASWIARRMIGTAVTTRSRFADIYSSAGLAYLRTIFERGSSGKRVETGRDFDLALLMSQNRALTQQISTHVYQLGYDGIYYPSRLGHDLFNWALFEPFELHSTTAQDVNMRDPDLTRALEHLSLRLDPGL